MTNIVSFPATRARPSHEQDQAWEEHAGKIRKACEVLAGSARGIPLDDRRSMCSRLGDLLDDRAREHGISRREALETVWAAFDPHGLNWSKRLRYIRFRDDNPNANSVIGSGHQFVMLAKCLNQNLPARGVSSERSEIQTLAVLVQGTKFDPDPTVSARIDFDVAKDLGTLIDAAMSNILAQAPALPEYFSRIDRHGLMHPPNLPFSFSWDSKVRPMPPNFGAEDRDLETFVAGPVFDWHAILAPIPENLKNGVTFYDLEGLGALLPRAVLGRIKLLHTISAVREQEVIAAALAAGLFPAATTVPKIGELSDTDLAALVDQLPALRSVLESNPDLLKNEQRSSCELVCQIELVLVPSEGSRVRAGLVVSFPWTEYDVLGLVTETARYRILSAGPELPVDCFPEGRVIMTTGGGHHPFGEQGHPALPDGELFDGLYLIPGMTADHVLGLRQTATEEAFASQPISMAIVIEPNFAVPDNFAPHAATSLGGKLLRNLLYAQPDQSVIHHLAMDAQRRIQKLEDHFQRWQAEYEKARHNFLSRSAPKT